MSELKITKKRVQKAAESCSQAKEVLQELFPEAFEGEGLQEINYDNLTDFVMIGYGLAPSKEYKGQCIVLNSNCEWEFTKNHVGNHVLIPRKK